MTAPPEETTVEVTTSQAIALAIEGLRELVEIKYHFDHRMSQILPGEKLPLAAVRGLEKRKLYLAAITELQKEQPCS